ncbi:ArsR/SmtB family transcription factor [Stackebrandtia nassauensis]|nr:ArsR family transcriptional regulator [Stackebrandtia nassauensis]
MIRFVLGVEDLVDTRFAVSPLQETVLSLRVLRDPGWYALHLPWRRMVLPRLDGLDLGLLLALVGRRHTLPDFLTPRPTSFAPAFEDEWDVARRAAPEVVRRELTAAYEPDAVPEVLRDAAGGDVGLLGEAVCGVLRRYWQLAIEPFWERMRLVMEADMTYRARQLAVGGARLLFADMHPHLRWRDGVLSVDKVVGEHRVVASGRGLLLIPSVFAHQPAPPVTPDEPPVLAYPSRGVATLWASAPVAESSALDSLLGVAKARILLLLEEPLATSEIARRLDVTPSAVSQQLRVLHDNGLVARARQGRQVLYRRSSLGDQLARRKAPS